MGCLLGTGDSGDWSKYPHRSLECKTDSAVSTSARDAPLTCVHVWSSFLLELQNAVCLQHDGIIARPGRKVVLDDPVTLRRRNAKDRCRRIFGGNRCEKDSAQQLNRCAATERSLRQEHATFASDLAQETSLNTDTGGGA